ncbi:MAG: hypothetical protein LBM18_05915 [Oscillospiraceae bacterium]|nr:hypothetical protein [Oscillospiraceae bacterium]
MVLSNAQTKKFLEYKGTPQIKQLALNMAFARLQRLYRANPGDVSKYTQELNDILGKYAVIMEADYRWITSL